jgi:integrase
MMEKDAARVARLTRRTVEGSEPASSRYTLWDADLKGFGLRVEPSGTKTYIVRYRVGGGRRGTLRQFKVGRSNKLTPDEARDQAKAILAQVDLGKDPQHARVEARKVATVAELCDLYLAEGCSTKKAATVALDRIRVEGHIKPLLGGRKITEVGKGDVERAMDAIATGRVKRSPQAGAEDGPAGKSVAPGTRARGGRTAATKAVKLLRAIFNFAIGRKLCAENPCIGVKTYADGRRERFLSPAELGRLGDALTAAEVEGAHPHHVAIVRLLSLTGARKNEIARLRWSEVMGDYLQLEDSKTGRKVIPLGAPAQQLIAGVARTASPYVFPDPRDASLPIRNLDWAWVGFRKRAGLEDVRIHDLRHSFASFAVSGGAALYLVSKVLGHAHVATTQRYAHLADDPVKAAADTVARRIAAALNGAAGEVDTMRGAAS